jgi:3-methyladenine DNA glycosylase AlkD
MTFKQTMATLKKLGTAQNMKTYRRHGAGENVFGVSFANLYDLKKKIKIDHDLAEQLWATRNTDAQTLAIMIADPEWFTALTADAWLRDIEYYPLTEMFAGLIAKSKVAASKLKKWTKAKKETTRTCGYSLLSCMLRDDPDCLDNEQCNEYLDTIEREIHDSPNRARHEMNMALVAIGIYRPEMKTAAIAAARHIGKVEVDHGDTSCKTPDAESYILKALQRKPRGKKKTRRV